MANLPSNRTKLNVAIANQQPSIVASSQANREALIEAYDTIDLLNQKTDSLVAGSLLVPFPPAGVSRQALINGNFDFWQRGTSLSGTGYIADRWRLFLGTGATIIVSQQAFAAGQANVPNNPSYYTQCDVQVVGTGTSLFTQRIENVNTFAGMTVAYGFWAKVANGTYALGTHINQNFGTGGSASVITGFGSHQLTASWKYFTGTLTIPGVPGKTIGGSSFTEFAFRFNTDQPVAQIHIAQVQLNAGSIALPFQPMHPADEFGLCQRYYQKTYNVDVPPGTNISRGLLQWVAGNASQAQAVGTLPLKVTMRTDPTVTIYAQDGTINSLTNQTAGTTIAGQLSIQGMNNVTVRPVTTGTFTATDRLSCHVTVDAEL